MHLTALGIQTKAILRDGNIESCWNNPPLMEQRMHKTSVYVTTLYGFIFYILYIFFYILLRFLY
jgi:hypothetical protein